MNVNTATVILLQQGRRAVETKEDAGAEDPKKGLLFAEWQNLRTCLSAAASPVEVRLLADIGQDLVTRYGPYPNKTVSLATRLHALESSEQRDVFRQVKRTWQDEWSTIWRKRSGSLLTSQPYSDELILRVAAYTAFEMEPAVDMLRRMNVRHWHVQATELKQYLRKGAILPLPGVSTSLTPHVIYMVPARFQHVEDPLRLFTYVLNCIYDRQEGGGECKVVVLVNLKDYQIEQQANFTPEDWKTWMELIQGHDGPVRAAQILFLNASSKFVEFYKSKLKQCCREGFAWKVKSVATPSDLKQYLKPDFGTYLPKEDFHRHHGTASLEHLAEDFLTYREALESILEEERNANVIQRGNMRDELAGLKTSTKEDNPNPKRQEMKSNLPSTFAPSQRQRRHHHESGIQASQTTTSSSGGRSSHVPLRRHHHTASSSDAPPTSTTQEDRERSMDLRSAIIQPNQKPTLRHRGHKHADRTSNRRTTK